MEYERSGGSVSLLSRLLRVGSWYTIGLCLGLGLGLSVAITGILGSNVLGIGAAAVVGAVLGGAIGLLIGETPETVAGAIGGALGVALIISIIAFASSGSEEVKKPTDPAVLAASIRHLVRVARTTA